MNNFSRTVNAERLARMVEVSRVLNSTTDLSILLSTIINEAAQLTETEAASILLLDPNTRQLHFKASSNPIPPQMANMPVSLDNSIAGAILRANKPMIIDDVSRDVRWNKKVDKAINFQTKSILGVPMHDVGGRGVGVLEALNKLDGSAFTVQDMETLAILADIAGVAVEKARLFAELEQANAELAQLDQLKTNFIAIASHELRTPLSVILGYLSFLREDASPAIAQQFDSVLQAAVHLRGLIQDMLNLRYVDAGEATLRQERVDFTALVRELAADRDETAAAKQQRVRIQLPPESMPVLLDPDMMVVVLSNLFSNAIKFTPQGGQITLRVLPRGAEVWFQIEDTGIGIPEEQLDRIFRRFYQVESPMRRHHEGMGLGLSIAREIVELHGGRIWAESGAGGSCFTVALALMKE